MTTRLILLLTLFSYTIIVSQSFMYILALKSMQVGLDINSYILVRKLIDASMRKNFKYVVYGSLLLNLILVILNISDPGGLLFIAATISLIALIVDTFITVKGNMPINAIINTWTPDNYPNDWEDYRTKWLTFLYYRQVANITGFVSLLTGVVFG